MYNITCYLLLAVANVLKYFLSACTCDNRTKAKMLNIGFVGDVNYMIEAAPTMMHSVAGCV